MTSPSESRISRTATSTGTAASTSRTRYGTSRTATRIAVGGMRFWRRMRSLIARATVRVRETVGVAGWLLCGAAVAGAGFGLTFGWIEFVVAGVIATALLLLCIPFLFGTRSYTVALSLARDRVVAGEEAVGALTVRNTARGIALPATVDVPIGEGIAEILVPLLGPGAHITQDVRVPAPRRGIVTIGPARTVRGDPLGILRRENVWKDAHTLYVHPVTTSIPSTSTGFVRDLEGNASTRIVDADISFHAIREYAPGDAQRQIHWKSTAKTGTLMVRQYEESRRARMLIALATADTEFASDEEFELAVSVAGSLGLRGIRDGRDVSVVVGQEIPEFARRSTTSVRELTAVSTRTLLDDLAGIGRRASVNQLGDVARLAVETHGDVSVGFLVCGSTMTASAIQSAALGFPSDIGVAAVICDPDAEPRSRRLGRIGVVTIGLIDDLRQILARGADR